MGIERTDSMSSGPRLESLAEVAEIEVAGHIIDSLILPKVLDAITSAGGAFAIKAIDVGQRRQDPSHARVEVRTKTPEAMTALLAQLADHGAVPIETVDCQIEVADIDGALPQCFYSTTNLPTELRLKGRWIAVERQEMDCGIVIDESDAPRCVPMSDIRKGDRVVVGHGGVRVSPPERGAADEGFSFMNSAVSTEKPKGVMIKRIAEALHANRESAGKTLLVGGPAIVHTGSGPLLSQLIRDGYIDLLFAGNALAAHDIEQAMFGTSLGVHLNDASLADAGHEHHLRAINQIRRHGSIAAAVEAGQLTSGVMYDCVNNGVDYLLAGSIRDDGPLPDVITDTLESQRAMRGKLEGVTFCLMIATTLHSIAVGNLLPAWVKVVCIDINPSTVIKLSDRGSFQTVGLVTDVAPFMGALVEELKRLETAQSPDILQ